jgi:hypothetical protein
MYLLDCMGSDCSRFETAGPPTELRKATKRMLMDLSKESQHTVFKWENQNAYIAGQRSSPCLWPMIRPVSFYEDDVSPFFLISFCVEIYPIYCTVASVEL